MLLSLRIAFWRVAFVVMLTWSQLISSGLTAPERSQDRFEESLEKYLAQLTSEHPGEPSMLDGESRFPAISSRYQDHSQESIGHTRQTDDHDNQPFALNLVNRGRIAFDSSCTECHDAERATSKRKSYGAWLATVRRMAAKEDADIPTGEYESIATFLASLGEGNSSDMSAGSRDTPSDESSFTLNGTLSAVYRGTDPAVENKGFFPDVWVGAEWRSANNPVSGKVIACTSCHGTNNGLGVELVEAAATLDLCQLISRSPPGKRYNPWQAQIKAGRFIVPFGGYSARVHPGSLRTVSMPLMYNMGRRVGPIVPLQPVLNLPYSDEGFDLHVRRDLPYAWNTTFDVYGVNGLQRGGSRVFFDSRSYRDNNSNVSIGSRATIGNKRIRMGGSIASGELQNEGLPILPYSLAGGDLSYRVEDTFRAQYEYAIRVEDTFPGARSIVYGNVVELELRLLSDPKISIMTRYDTLEHRGALGEQSTERFTWGLNWVLYGGSLLILNHERWVFDDTSRANIFGLRWTTAF